MQHKPELVFSTRDSLGKAPDMALIGTNWKHSGNGKIYHLSTYAWEGESDRWLFVMYAKDSPLVPIARPLEHLNGDRQDGSSRYLRMFALGEGEG